MSSDLRRDLVAALADFYVGHPDAQRFSMLGTVGNLLVAALEADEVVEPDPVALPVARLLAGCESAIDAGSAVPGVGAVLRAFTAAAPILHWVQTAEYAATLSQHFLDNYGYVRVIGPGGLVESDVASAGLGVWGAGLHYPGTSTRLRRRTTCYRARSRSRGASACGWKGRSGSRCTTPRGSSTPRGSATRPVSCRGHGPAT